MQIEHSIQHSMTANQSTLQAISQTLPQVGRLEAIIVRPARGADCFYLQQTMAIKGIGLADDRRGLNSHTTVNGSRQVTLIQAEHIEVIAQLVGLSKLDPALLRRNLLVSGINLLAIKPLFKHHINYLQVGQVLFEIVGDCDPCSRMETLLGAGGYNAMRGHGGVNAKIVQGGQLSVGDTIHFVTHTQQMTLI